MAFILRDAGIRFVREHQFHPRRRWRFDFALPERRIAIEVEGGVFSQGRHTRGVGFMKDCEKYNAATALGWRIFRFPANHISHDCLKPINQLIQMETASDGNPDTSSKG